MESPERKGGSRGLGKGGEKGENEEDTPPMASPDGHHDKPESRLRVTLGSLELENPVMNASGTWGSGLEATDLLGEDLPGALVTKTVTLHPRPGNPMPRLVETSGGLLNSIGLMNPGVEVFLKEILPAALELGPPLVVNLGGDTLKEFSLLAERLTGKGAAALEVNLSCPNVLGGRLPFATSPQVVEEVIRAVRERTAEPLWAKISPNVTDPVEIARAAARGGADALVCANTLLGMAVDWRGRRPRLPLGMGGYSGPPVKPVALRIVWQTAQAVDLPIVGVGGIATAEDVLEFLAAGARAVQVGTASLARPDAMARILEDLRSLAAEENLVLSSFSGAALPGGLGGKR